MASNILNIGQSALAAAQVGISTTGHNIANAATPGYSRQVVVQSAAQSQNFGYGYVGQGAQVTAVTRVYNELLSRQVTSSQSSSAAINAYSAQIKQLDNLLADDSAGLSSAMQQFFSSLQTLSTNPGDAPSRQAMLSTAHSFVGRFQDLGERMEEIRSGINVQLQGHVTEVNSYAKQIAGLNDVISKAIGAEGYPPNDLMDQRDLLVSELSKLVKTSVVNQGNGEYNLFIGNGLPLVVGTQSYGLQTMASPTDPTRLEIAYQGKSSTSLLAPGTLAGGSLGGLLEFRTESLDSMQNQLGRIALVLADSFNTQHKQGLDSTGAAGTDFFSVAAPLVSASGRNTGSAELSVNVVQSGAVTASDYRLQYDGSQYKLTRLNDGQVQAYDSLPQTVDGISIALGSGSLAAGDEFVIKPTYNVASTIKVTLDDISQIAAGGPAPSGSADNRNLLLLAGLQTSNTLNGGTTTYQGAYNQLISMVGNKTRELSITGAAEERVLAYSVAAQQSESGVNLDEEATNLLRYQQAYQAAGKFMQIADQMFDILLALGR